MYCSISEVSTPHQEGGVIELSTIEAVCVSQSLWCEASAVGENTCTIAGSRIGSARGPGPDPHGVTPRRQGHASKSVRPSRDECALQLFRLLWCARVVYGFNSCIS
jgi:hypothetical protein